MASPQKAPLVIIASQDQLSDEGKKICDDLLGKILDRDYPFSRKLTVDDIRFEFWRIVFQDGWTTAHRNPKPSFTQLNKELDYAREAYAGVHAGTLRTPTPATVGSSKSLKRKREPAFLKVDFKYGVGFRWYDKNGTTVSFPNVEPHERSFKDSEKKAMQDWDIHDIKRVSNLNRPFIAYWGRNRVIALANSHGAEPAASHEEEDLDLLLRPVLSRRMYRSDIKKSKTLLHKEQDEDEYQKLIQAQQLYQPCGEQDSNAIFSELALIYTLRRRIEILTGLSYMEHPNIKGHWY